MLTEQQKIMVYLDAVCQYQAKKPAEMPTDSKEIAKIYQEKVTKLDGGKKTN